MRLRLHLVAGLEAMLTRLHLLLPQQPTQPTQRYACEVPTAAGVPGPKETSLFVGSCRDSGLWRVVLFEWRRRHVYPIVLWKGEDCDFCPKTPRAPSCPDARGHVTSSYFHELSYSPHDRGYSVGMRTTKSATLSSLGAFHSTLEISVLSLAVSRHM